MDSENELPQGEYEKGKNVRLAVQEIVANLPLRQREAVMLHYYDDLDVALVAEAMDIPHQSALSYLSLARKRLAAELDRRGLAQNSSTLGFFPMGALLSETLHTEAAEFIPTKAAWIQGTLELCRQHINEGSAGFAAAAPEIAATAITAVRLPFGAVMGTLTALLIAGALALGISLGGTPQPKHVSPATSAIATFPAEGRPSLQEYEIVVSQEPPPFSQWNAEMGNKGVPRIELGNKGVLLYSPDGMQSWALMNFVLCTLGAFYAVLCLERILLKGKRGTKEHIGKYPWSLRFIRGLADGKADANFRPAWLAVTSAMAALGAVLFLLTQNPMDPMVLLDKWTLLHVLFFATQLAGVILVIQLGGHDHAKSCDIPGARNEAGL